MSIDLNNLKTQIKSILDTANTTTATHDLSSGMSRRVQQVAKTNIEKINIQGSLWPAVCIYTNGKSIEQQTISRDQLSAVRESTINITIAGLVFNPIFSTLPEDPADEDIEKLMENIEQIMRANPTINSTSTWSFPLDVSYHSGIIEEETHARVGIMNFEMTVHY